jgi:hypothetical protein
MYRKQHQHACVHPPHPAAYLLHNPIPPPRSLCKPPVVPPSVGPYRAVQRCASFALHSGPAPPERQEGKGVRRLQFERTRPRRRMNILSASGETMQQKGVRQLRPGTTTVLISCGRISKFQNDMRQFFSGQRALLLSRPLPQMPLPLSQQLRMGLRDKRFAQVGRM